MKNTEGILRKFRVGKFKKLALAAVCGVGLASVSYLFYANMTIVKIGANSTHYTYSDINRYYGFVNNVADVTGGQPLKDRSAAFQVLAVAAMQKEILEAKKVSINRDRAMELIESQSLVRGMLKKERKKMGEDDYYRLVIEPAAVGQLFASYYRTNDPSGKVARTALDAALQGGIGAAAQRANQKSVEVKIPAVPENAAFVAEAKNNLGGILPKIVEDDNGYSIVLIKEVNDQHVTAEVVSIPRKAFGQFVRDELKSLNIPYTNTFYSWFRVAELEKPGAIFGDTAKVSKTVSR